MSEIINKTAKTNFNSRKKYKAADKHLKTISGGVCFLFEQSMDMKK